MIIGINKYDQDLEVNPCKERAKSGVRRNQAEITQIQLKAIKPLTLEFALTFLAKDEILEVTPENLRLRKQYLTKTQREWSKRENLTDFAKKRLGK
jgi:GTP-binding protein